MNITFKYSINQRVRSVNHPEICGTIDSAFVNHSGKIAYWVKSVDSQKRLQEDHFFEEDIESDPAYAK